MEQLFITWVTELRSHFFMSLENWSKLREEMKQQSTFKFELFHTIKVGSHDP